MAERIRQRFIEEIDNELFQAEVKGIKFKGEYIVDIYYGRVDFHGWRAEQREHIECKRLSTINKRLAQKGFTGKVA